MRSIYGRDIANRSVRTRTFRHRTVVTIVTTLLMVGCSGSDKSADVEPAIQDEQRAVSPGGCPADLVELELALDYLNKLHNGGTENHINPAKLGRPELKSGFEWYGSWDGKRFESALNSVRDQIPRSVLSSFDEYVASAVAWVNADKRWMSTIEIVTEEQFQFPESGYSGTNVFDLYYRYPVDSMTQDNTAITNRAEATSRHFDSRIAFEQSVLPLDRSVIVLEGGLLSAFGFPKLECNVGLAEE